MDGTTTAMRRWIRERAELLMLCSLLLGAVGIAAATSDRGLMPPGVFGVGLVGGAILALQGAGLVLVYRSNRIINFAQIPIAALGAVAFVASAQHRLLLVALAKVCPPCMPAPASVGDLRAAGGSGSLLLDAAGLSTAPESMPLTEALDATGQALDPGLLSAAVAPGWLVQLNYWASLLLAIALVAALMWTVYVGLVKRFASSPRLIVTVLTIGLGSLVATVAGALAGVSQRFGGGYAASASVPPPIEWRLNVRPAVFSGADVLVVLAGVAAAVLLAVHLRRSATGIMGRGAAENPERAQTLGANLTSLAARMWFTSGLLAGAASVLSAARLGATSVEGVGFLVRTLAAVVVGGMMSLPLMVAGALGIAVADQAVLWSTRSTVLTSLLLLVLIAAVLLVQRSRGGRAGTDETGWVGTREIRPVPRELRDVRVVRRTGQALALSGLLLIGGYPWFMSSAQVSLATGTMVFAMIGLSLLVLTGWAGQISLGHIAFAAVGAWVTAVLPLPFALSVLAGALAGGVVAVLVGFPALRLRGLHLAISTLALGTATAAVLLDDRYLGRLLPEQITRPMFFGLDFDDDRSFFYLTLVVLILTIGGVVGLRRSRVGRALIACRDNEAAAQAYGISVLQARSSAFAVSGFIAAAAGGLLVYAERGVEALSFTPERNIEVFLMTVLGGLGSVAGPVIGAAYLGLLRVASDSAFGPILEVLAAPGLGVVILLLFLPGGLSQAVYGSRDAWLRRIASRHRIEVPSLVAHRYGEGMAPIAPLNRDGEVVEVPAQYRPRGQWMVMVRRRDRRKERAGV